MALYVLFKNKNFFYFLLYLAFIKPTNVSDHFAGPCMFNIFYSFYRFYKLENTIWTNLHSHNLLFSFCFHRFLTTFFVLFNFFYGCFYKKLLSLKTFYQWFINQFSCHFIESLLLFYCS